MRKLARLSALFAMLYAFYLPLSSQAIHLGIGYNANFTGLKGLNAVVDDYNESRSFLSNDMNRFKYLGGMTIHASAGAGGFMMGFDYSWRRNTNISTGTFGGTDFTRYIRMKQDVFAFNLGGVASETGAAFSGGLRMELSNPKVFTRLREGANPIPEWELLNSPVLHASIGPYAKLYFGPKEMWPAGFFVSTYYCYSLFKTKMHEVDEFFSGADYSLDEPPAKFVSRNNVFGIAVGYGVLFSGN